MELRKKNCASEISWSTMTNYFYLAVITSFWMAGSAPSPAPKRARLRPSEAATAAAAFAVHCV